MSRHASRFALTRTACALAAAASFAAGAAAAADTGWTGSFSGTVQAELLPLNFPPPRPESFYDGATVTGSFEVRLADPQFQFGADPRVGFTDPNGYLRLSYLINGVSFDYEAGLAPGAIGTPSIELSQSPSGSQQVDFRTSFQPRFLGGTISFTGNGLFSSFDPSTIDLSGSGLGFATSFADSGAEMFFDVAVNRFSVTPVGVVPEPATWALYALGALAVGLGVRRRR